MLYSIKLIIFISLLTLLNLNATTINLTQKEKDFIKKHPTITLGAARSWEPVVIQNKDGSISGYNTDILELVNKATGANFIEKAGDWMEIQEEANNKQIDGLSTVIITPDRKKLFNFSQIYLSFQKMLLVKGGNPLNIKTSEDLAGKTIAIVKGIRADEKAVKKFKNSKVIYADTPQKSVEMVIFGDADATFGNGGTLYLLSKLGLPMMDNIFSLDNDLDLRFAVRNDFPEAISILEKGLSSIPEYQRLHLKQKWLTSAKKEEVNRVQFTDQEFEYLKNKEKILMCIDPNWMPFESFDKEGKHIGIAADYFKIFNDLLPINIETVKTNTWNESLQKIKNKECDILSLAMSTPSRESYLKFTTPYLEVPLVIATKTNVPFINDISSLEDKKVGITKGYAFVELLQAKYPKLNIIEVKNIDEGLEKVNQGELFGFIGTLASVSNTFQEGYHGLLKISGKFIENWELSIAVHSDEATLFAILDKVVKSVDLEKHKKILDQWISVQYTQHVDYTLLWQLLALFAIIGTLSLYWMRKISNANKTITESLDNFQYFFNHTIETIGLFQNDKCININDAAIKLFGFDTKEDAIGLSPFAFVAPQSIQKVQEEIQKNSIHSYEAFATKQDGTIFPVLIKAYYKKLYGINTRVVCLIDLTEIKEQEEFITLAKNKVESSNQEFQLMLDSIMEGVGIFENNICIDLNHVALNMFGYNSKEELVGSGPLVFIDPSDHQKALDAIAKNNPEPYEVNGYHKDGSTIPLLVKAFTLVTDARTLRIVSAIDLTDAKEKEKALKFARNKALEASQTKSEFLANMSHEIRTPMNGITGMTTLALKTNLDEKQRHYLNQIDNSSKNLLLIINDILDFSKIEAGKLDIDKTDFNLEQLVNSIIDLVKPKADEKNLDLQISYEKDILVDLYGDSLRISQILINLLNNAIKFTANGYVHLKIRSIDQKYIFNIQDSGIGMNLEEQSKLFQPFSQVDGTITRKYGGTGLGLSICKQLVELMNGIISVESQEGSGSDFQFELELQKSKNKISHKRDTIVTIENLKILNNCNILLIEDNQINQEIVIGLLEHNKIAIDTASNGAIGVALYKNNISKYDLIFMDLQMPIMDGFEATKIIRNLNDTIPIIALSANAMNQDVKNSIKHGMDQHLNKPIEVDKLYKVLLEFIPNKIELQSTSSEQTSDDSNLHNFHTIDTKVGLSHMGNNKKLYHKILNDFYSKYENLELDTTDAKELKRTIHTIKGLAGNIGAEELSKVAKDIETSLDETKKIDQISSFEPFYNELNRVLKELQNFDILEKNSDTKTFDQISTEKRDELFTKLKEYAQKRRAQKCNDIIDQLNQYTLHNDDKKTLEKITQLLKQRDYKNIMETL